MQTGILRNACDLLLLNKEVEKVQHVYDTMMLGEPEYGINEAQNLYMYDFPQSMRVMFYEKPNRHHDDQLVIVQSSVQSIKDRIREELSAVNVSEVLVAHDGYPIHVFEIPGYKITLILGDAAQPSRHTVRITKQQLGESENQLAIVHFAKGRDARTAKNIQKAVSEFSEAVFHNPFSDNFRFNYGSSLAKLAMPTSVADQIILRQAEAQLKVSRALGYEDFLVNDEIDWCTLFRMPL